MTETESRKTPKQFTGNSIHPSVAKNGRRLKVKQVVNYNGEKGRTKHVPIDKKS